MATLKGQPDFESRRDQKIRQRIWTDIQSDPVLLAQIKTEWVKAESIQAWYKFCESAEYQTRFRKFYDSQVRCSSS